MPSINLGNYIADDNSEPYLIAEIGVNHEGSIDKAKELIDLAKEGGAHAAKFQSYKANTLASRNSPAYWDLGKEKTTSQYELFKKYDSFTEKDYIELAEYCKSVDIDFLSTPFDDASIDFLDPLIPFYKIASADITNIPFLRKIAKKNKPVVLSTGASTPAEIDIAVNEIQNITQSGIALLHCILNYPTDYSNANLNMINGLIRLFPDLVVGYSDHTLPDPCMNILIASYLKGARIIEKHFTHDKTLPGNDHYHAMDVSDLKTYVKQLKFIREAEGKSSKTFLNTEIISRNNARRSIVLSKGVKAGDIVEEAVLTCKRPGTGISPLHWDEIIGMRFTQDLEDDHIVMWHDISKTE